MSGTDGAESEEGDGQLNKRGGDGQCVENTILFIDLYFF